MRKPNQEIPDQQDKSTGIYYIHTKWYSFTICPEYQLPDDKDRFKRIQNYIYETVLSALNGIAEYRYNIEISEPHGTCFKSCITRIHAHGRFMLNDLPSVRQFLLFGLRNLSQMGIIEIDTINDINVWDAYCEKQMEVTKVYTIFSAAPTSPTPLIKPYDNSDVFIPGSIDDTIRKWKNKKTKRSNLRNPSGDALDPSRVVQDG